MRHLFFLLFLSSLATFAQSNEVKIMELLKANKVAQAEELFLKDASLSQNTKVIETIGDAFGREKNWDSCLEFYKKLVEIHPNSANYHYKYGGALGMKSLSVSKIKALGYVDDVKKHFETAANLDPKHLEARWALIELYVKLPGIVGGSFKKAEKYADELLKIKTIEGYIAKAYVADEMGNSMEAEMFYKGALKYVTSINESYPRENIHYQIGKICARYNVEHQTGLKHLNWFLEIQKPSGNIAPEWAHYQMSIIYKKQKNKPEALKSIDKALAAKPDFKQGLEQKRAILAM